MVIAALNIHNSKEAFHTRTVSAISSPAHTLYEALQAWLEKRRCIK